MDEFDFADFAHFESCDQDDQDDDYDDDEEDYWYDLNDYNSKPPGFRLADQTPLSDKELRILAAILPFNVVFTFASALEQGVWEDDDTPEWEMTSLDYKSPDWDCTTMDDASWPMQCVSKFDGLDTLIQYVFWKHPDPKHMKSYSVVRYNLSRALCLSALRVMSFTLC
jgi:hypothetical protein